MRESPLATAVVTSAGSGIGRAIATRLAHEGVRVVVNDLDVDAVSHVAKEIGAMPFSGDAATDAGVVVLHDYAKDHLGEIDAWFGNAGSTSVAAWTPVRRHGLRPGK